MVVWTEFPNFDMITATDAFTQNCEQQLIELIRQNYNHPSIFFWSIANEPTLSRGPDVQPLLADLAALAHREDPTRLSTLASANTNPYEYLHTDAAGFNIYEGWYIDTLANFSTYVDTLHTNHPTLLMGVSEYGAGASAYFHSDTPHAQDHTEEYQCLFHESYWEQRQPRPYLWGTFIWVMFDVAASTRNEGDRPGINDKGLVTFDRGVRKDAYYFYRANWSTDPFVYITERRWTMRTNPQAQIKVYSNLPSVTASLNGVSLGEVAGHNGVFVWSPITLASGANVVRVQAVSGNASYGDAVRWTLSP
jgi:beta-galactosidase